MVSEDEPKNADPSSSSTNRDGGRSPEVVRSSVSLPALKLLKRVRIRRGEGVSIGEGNVLGRGSVSLGGMQLGAAQQEGETEWSCIPDQTVRSMGDVEASTKNRECCRL
jgi:hypothetical protein